MIIKKKLITNQINAIIFLFFKLNFVVIRITTDKHNTYYYKQAQYALLQTSTIRVTTVKHNTCYYRQARYWSSKSLCATSTEMSAYCLFIVTSKCLWCVFALSSKTCLLGYEFFLTRSAKVKSSLCMCMRCGHIPHKITTVSSKSQDFVQKM